MSGAFPDFVFAALLAVLTVGGTVALAIGSYLLGRKLLLPLSGEETRDLAGSVIFRVSALHGLILALVFAGSVVGRRVLRFSCASLFIMRQQAVHTNHR